MDDHERPFLSNRLPWAPARLEHIQKIKGLLIRDCEDRYFNVQRHDMRRLR